MKNLLSGSANFKLIERTQKNMYAESYVRMNATVGYVNIGYLARKSAEIAPTVI